MADNERQTMSREETEELRRRALATGRRADVLAWGYAEMARQFATPREEPLPGVDDDDLPF